MAAPTALGYGNAYGYFYDSAPIITASSSTTVGAVTQTAQAVAPGISSVTTIEPVTQVAEALVLAQGDSGPGAIAPVVNSATAAVLAQAESSTEIMTIHAGEVNTIVGLNSSVTLDSVTQEATMVFQWNLAAEQTLDAVTQSSTAFVFAELVGIDIPGDAYPIVLFPNWKNQYTITYEFKTDIFTARSGREQRRALRQTPRKTLEFTTLLTDDKRRQVASIMAGWQDRRFLMPEHPMAVPGGAMPANGGSMFPPEIPSWAVVGSMIILLNGDVAEARYLLAKVDGELVFGSTTSTEWPEDTKIAPGLIGRFEDDINARRHTNNVEEMSVDFVVDPGYSANVAPPDPARTHLGVELFDRRPNWKPGVNGIYQAVSEVLDFGFGVTSYFAPADYGTMSLKFRHLCRDTAEVRGMIDFFKRRKGRQKSFYMPTWQSDLAISSPLTAGDEEVFVKDAVHGQFLGSNLKYKDICFVGRDGVVYPARITNMVGGGGNTRLDLAEPAPLSSDEIAFICWLPRVRLFTDSLPLNFHTTAVAEVDLTMVTLESDL